MEKLKEICKQLESIVSAEVARGVEKTDTKELGEAIDMIKDLKEAMYYGSVVEAMEKSEEEEKLMNKMGMSYYRGQPRNERGQYKEDGRPNKYYQMATVPEMISIDRYDKMPEEMQREYMRGYSDGMDNGRRMYQNAANMGINPNQGGNEGTRNYDGQNNRGGNYGGNNEGSRMYERDMREGRSGMSRARYYDAKQNHRNNTSEDKQAKMRELENYMNELATDITEMIADASQEEKTMLKTKLINLSNKIV